LFRFLFLFFSIILIAQSSELENVKLQLKWKHQFQFAGYYMAKEKGFYKKVGLDVNIIEYTNGVDIVKTVEKPKDGGVYGVGYPNIILDKANGASIKLINAIYQLSPHILLSLKSSNIHSIEDFKNKRMMIGKEAVKSISFMAMLTSHHLSLNDLKQLEPSFDINSLIDKKADLITSYISNEPYLLKKRGIAFNIWNPSDYGFDFYDDILFTSTNELYLHPKRVEVFKKASLKGWEYAFEHIDETVQIILTKYNTQHKTKDALLYEAKELKKLAFIDNIKFGDLNKNKIKRIIDIYNLFGLVYKNVDIDNFIYKLPKNYALDKDEKNYLKNKQVITMCIDPNWMPYESFKDGKYIGISADYFNLIKAKFHFNIDLLKTEDWNESLEFAKARKCDILSLAMPTENRSKYLNFTKPYMKIPLVIATKTNELFINDVSLLRGKKLAITQGYAFKDILEQKYPYLKLVDVKNIQDGLFRVKEGEFYAYIGTLMSVSYAIQKEFLGELKISGKFDSTWDLGIAVRNDDSKLLQIMQKAVQSINENQKQKIVNDWISIEYVESTDYDLLFKGLGISFIIILIVLFLYRKEKKLKEKIEIQNIIFDTIINTVPNPMFYKDKNGIYQDANDTFAEKILGVQKDKLIGKSLNELSDIFSKENIDFYNEQDKKLFESNKNQVYETTFKIKNGSLRTFRIQKNIFYSFDGDILGYVCFMYDITELKDREKELEYMASVDSMTKLYNRRYFSEIGESILKLAKRKKHFVSIVMFDIDDFKKVNDTYGHKIGDDVIISVANTMHNISRNSDIACRFGGEEFILLLPDTDANGALIIAQKIRKTIEITKINVDENKKINVTVSVGVAVVDIDKKLEISIQRVDSRLYKAKENGKNRVEYK